MPDLTPDRLARLRAHVDGFKRAGWGGAEIDPDVVLRLLEEIDRLRAALATAADLPYPADPIDDCAACGAASPGLHEPESHEPDCPWRVIQEARAAATDARAGRPQPGGTRLDDILSEDEIAELATERREDG